jgi:hypothetical protein
VLVSSLLLSPCVCFFRFCWVGLLVELSSAGDLKQTHSYILLYSVLGIYFCRACRFLLYCSLLVFVSSGFVVLGFLCRVSLCRGSETDPLLHFAVFCSCLYFLGFFGFFSTSLLSLCLFPQILLCWAFVYHLQ